MNPLILVILFLLLMLVGVPIAYVLGIVTFVGFISLPAVSNMVVFIKMFNSLNSFPLLAVPLFILAANLMNSGKISQKLIDWCVALLGPLKGGLAYANILVSMIFAGVSGSSQADTAGVGSILIPNMENTGYDKETSVGVTAASSTIGVIIPPSITMIIYCGLTNVSTSSMFCAGIIPGVLIGLAMMAVVKLGAKKKNFPSYPRIGFKQFVKISINAFPALLTPVIILGGILTGWYTATEAASFACVYAFVVGMFVYKTISLKDVPKILLGTLKLSCLSLFAYATASALGELMAFYGLKAVAGEFFASYIPNGTVFLILVIAFYLFLGTFMDAVPAMILFVPVLLGPAISFGINPILLGMVIVITCAIGNVTPPYGLCLLIACSISKLPIERGIKGATPYLISELIVLALTAFIPVLSLWLPGLIYGL